MGSWTTEVLFVPRANLLPEATVKVHFSSFLQCRGSAVLTLAINLMIQFFLLLNICSVKFELSLFVIR